MTMLRFMIWNALLLLRCPIQFFVRVMMFLSLGGTIVGVVMIFTGTGNEQFDVEAPLFAKLLAPVIMTGTYFLWSGVSYLYDSAVFKLTPEGRTLSLFD